ncbi:MAG: tetratricopeptide repeat protein [Planctomycetes bacterium]|nr:tetratricopeptide repeat protein [Planctomycetota bacterium]
MIRALLPVLWLVAACASVERPDADLRAATAPAVSSAPLPVAPLLSADAGASRRDVGGRAFELWIWNDPVFRRQFVESYAAETEIEPRLATPERETMQKILDLMGANKPDEAIALIVKSTSGASSAVFDFTLANLHFQADRLPEAAQAYTVATQKFPKFRRAWRNLALIRVRQGEYADAARAFVRVVELGSGDAVTYGLLAYAYSNLGDHLAAESGFRLASMLDPQTLDWKMGLARSFFEQRRYADAAALCDQLLAADPERADLWLLQANAFIGLNQPKRAAENYELVDGLGRSTPDSLNTLADIYVNDELYDLAVDAYVRAMQLDPRVGSNRAIRAAKALTARGASAAVKRLVEAIEDVHAGRLSAEERKDVLKLRARHAVAEGAGAEEARILEEIVALDPLDGEALILLGQQQGRAGDVEKAIFWFERAASLEAFEADAKVRHAQLLVGKGRYSEALPLLRRAQTIKPRENIQQYLEQVERVAQTR